MLQQSRTVAENNSSKNEVFIRSNTVSKEKSYAGAVTSRNTKNGTTTQVIVFGNSVIWGVRVRDSANQHLKNGFAEFKDFSDCDCKEMLHYAEPTL